MNLEQQLVFLNKNYQILYSEQEFIIHPAAFGLLPMTKAALHYSYKSEFHIENYQLYLDKLTLHPGEVAEKQYEFKDCASSYNGAILIGTNLVKEYPIKGLKTTCFSYQNVLELVFEDGILITSIDQSKAMLRIRKNLELNLRNLNRGRDLRCIKRFMNSAFIGDYKAFKLPLARKKYIEEMRKDYIDYKFIKNNMEA